MSRNPTVEDLREHRRYTVAGTFLRVIWLDENGDLQLELGARPLDISETGMSLELPNAALLMSRVRFESGPDEVVGHGKVRNCRRNESKYIVGIEFTDSLSWRAPEGPVVEPIPLSSPPVEGECMNLQDAVTGCPDELLLATEPAQGAMPPSPAPCLWSGAGSPGGFLAGLPMPVKVGAPLLLTLLLGLFMIGLGGKTPVAGASDATTPIVGEQGWVTEWASDAAGSRRGRQITLYRPSANLSDYRMQFTGQIESKALGWVFRAADTRNYYGMKIESDTAGSVLYTRFAVVHGLQRSVTQKRLPIKARVDTAYNVILEAKGPRFAVYIQGEPVELWTDSQLKVGALGFMNDSEERGRTSSVRVSF